MGMFWRIEEGSGIPINSKMPGTMEHIAGVPCLRCGLMVNVTPMGMSNMGLHFCKDGCGRTPLVRALENQYNAVMVGPTLADRILGRRSSATVV